MKKAYKYFLLNRATNLYLSCDNLTTGENINHVKIKDDAVCFCDMSDAVDFYKKHNLTGYDLEGVLHIGLHVSEMCHHDLRRVYLELKNMYKTQYNYIILDSKSFIIYVPDSNVCSKKTIQTLDMLINNSELFYNIFANSNVYYTVDKKRSLKKRFPFLMGSQIIYEIEFVELPF